jgi:transposase
VDTPETKEDVSMRRKRRLFSPEFKAETVKLVDSGRSMSEVGRELGLHVSVVSEWVRQAKADAGKGPPEALTSAEKAELSELRRRVKRLEMEKEILKKAAAFFAKESE